LALLEWFDKFPEFKTNNLYLTGISYAGIYLPFIANKIDQHNTESKYDSTMDYMNLKGILVGNGLVDYTVDGYPSLP